MTTLISSASLRICVDICVRRRVLGSSIKAALSLCGAPSIRGASRRGKTVIARGFYREAFHIIAMRGGRVGGGKIHQENRGRARRDERRGSQAMPVFVRRDGWWRWYRGGTIHTTRLEQVLRVAR